MLNVTPSSSYINAYGGSSTYVGSNPNNPVQGMLRLQNHGELQVFDGAGWVRMDMNISVGLNSEGEAAITWARERMAQERKWAELARQHPAVADALAARERAEEALATVSRLCGELES